MKKKIAYILGTCFGIGYFPLAPGTLGSLLAVLVLWLFQIDQSLNILIIFMLLITGIWAGNIIEKDKGKDPEIIVIDEFTGQWITFLFLPKSVIILCTGFLLFRTFDILKPFPINKSENLSGGFGIMADDILAAVFANILIQCLVWFHILS